MVSSFNYFKMHVWSTSMLIHYLLLLHSLFMLSVVKIVLKGEVGGHALNCHGNYIADHGKSWKNHGIVFLNFCGNPGYFNTYICNASMIKQVQQQQAVVPFCLNDEVTPGNCSLDANCLHSKHSDDRN